MSDLRKVFVGQQIKKFPAHTWNKLLAGELRDRGRRNPSDVQTGSPHSPVIARLRWEGASAIGPGAAVKLTNSIFIPGTDEFGGSYGLGFACVAFGAGDSLDNYAITLGPIETGGENIGYGVIPEAWWVQVNVTDTGHTHAKIVSAGTQLGSAATGLKILWKPAGTGVKWAVVLLSVSSGGSSTEWFGRVTEAIDGAIGWAKADAGSGMVQEVDEDGDDVGDPKEVYSRYFNTVPVGVPVYCTDKGDGTHEFKRAGCSPGP